MSDINSLVFESLWQPVKNDLIHAARGLNPHLSAAISVGKIVHKHFPNLSKDANDEVSNLIQHHLSNPHNNTQQPK